MLFWSWNLPNCQRINLKEKIIAINNAKDFASRVDAAKALSQVHEELFVICRASQTYTVESGKIAVEEFRLHGFPEDLL